MTDAKTFGSRSLGHNQQSDNPFSGHFYTDFVWAMRTAIREGLREGLGSATVQVDPHAATQADATASTQLPRR